MFKSQKLGSCLMLSSVGLWVATAFNPWYAIPCIISGVVGSCICYESMPNEEEPVVPVLFHSMKPPVIRIDNGSAFSSFSPQIFHSEIAITINHPTASPVILNQYRNNYTTDTDSVMEPRPQNVMEKKQL